MIGLAQRFLPSGCRRDASRHPLNVWSTGLNKSELGGNDQDGSSLTHKPLDCHKSKESTNKTQPLLSKLHTSEKTLVFEMYEIHISGIETCEALSRNKASELCRGHFECGTAATLYETTKRHKSVNIVRVTRLCQAAESRVQTTLPRLKVR